MFLVIFYFNAHNLHKKFLVFLGYLLEGDGYEFLKICVMRPRTAINLNLLSYLKIVMINLEMKNLLNSEVLAQN